MALLGKEFLQLRIVLDDAVVDQRDGLVLVHMGMGVLVRDAAVRAPPAVRQADLPAVPCLSGQFSLYCL